jgi:UDP-N-acetylmuramoylalanine--D-glutamate ligase
VLLNVTEDHLDRYPSFEAYASAKGNAFVNQTPADVAVIPAGDSICAEQARRGHGRVVTFGASDADYAIVRAEIVERRARGGAPVPGREERFPLEATQFHGTHNYANAAAALAAARALGVDAAAGRAGLTRFVPLGHRMAFVRDLERIRYYDDSKATNVGAAVTALSGITEPRAVLIAGGRDKLGAYEPLVAALTAKGRAVVVIGEAADRIAMAIGETLPVARAATMEEAVLQARSLAEPGDAVLLSPACASFDMFKSYADRGDRFAAAVRSLEPRRTS